MMKLPGARRHLQAFLKTEQRDTLKSLLFDDESSTLRSLVADGHYDALLPVIQEGPSEFFARVNLADGGNRLRELLFSNDGAAMCALLQAGSDEALAPLFRNERDRFLGATESSALMRAVEARLPVLDLVEALLHSEPLRDLLLNAQRLNASAALYAHWRSLLPLLPERTPKTQARLVDALQHIESDCEIRNRILDIICDEYVVHLAHGNLRFPDRHSLWTLLHEILVHEDYYFPCATETPRILDGGSHMGMALYYFKSRFPGARITGFEPVPPLRDLAAENMAANGMEAVEILPYALAAERGETEFYISESWSMASSLHDHRTRMGDAVRPTRVECVPLSGYLDEPVDFLKLDIEGSEAEVLAESAGSLHRVHYIFCEYHQGNGLASGRLAQILETLERAGFDVQVSKSHNFQATSLSRPFNYFDNNASMLIWARNRDWSDEVGEAG